MAERKPLKTFQDILDALPDFRAGVEAVQSTLLANLAIIGELPAPTFGEKNRSDMIQQRFSEAGLRDVSSDQAGNALAIRYGRNEKKNILLVAHIDSVFPDELDHSVTIQPNRVVGPGVGDNSLGCAMLATLPTLLDHLGIEFDSNLVLLGASRGLGRGNLEGIRFFLDNNDLPIQAGVCVEGVQLGRLSIASLGMLRGEITCRVKERYDWTRFGTAGAIYTMNEVINRLMEIPLPRRPRTTIVMGSIEGGASYNTIATSAVLRFEIRSESAEMVEGIRERVEDIVSEVSSKTPSHVELDIFARRTPGGIASSHPLPRAARNIMKSLEIKHRLAPSTSELSALIDKGIPGLTIGLTTGEHLNQEDEAIAIEPIASGAAQLLALLLAIDKGFCDDDSRLAK